MTIMEVKQDLTSLANREPIPPIRIITLRASVLPSVASIDVLMVNYDSAKFLAFSFRQTNAFPTRDASVINEHDTFKVINSRPP
jgi:hypothetical protein